jgi:hypothetical protein
LTPASASASADENKTNVDGIPFYIKVARCKQETSWIQPFYTLTLKKTVKFKFLDEDAAKKAAAKLPESIVTSATKTLNLTKFRNDEVQNLRALLSKPGIASKPESDLIEAKWKTISGWSDYVPLSEKEDVLVKSEDVVEVSNTSAPDTLVDYSRVYYYNTPRPWVGSSQVDAKLAADGTLSEGSSQVQSQTLSTIISALPISALLSKAAGIGAAAGPGPGVQIEQTVQYELTIQEDAYKHTHARYVKFGLPCALEKDGVKSDYALTIDTSGQGSSKKDDDNTVKVNGAIVLPKAKSDTAK